MKKEYWITISALFLLMAGCAEIKDAAQKMITGTTCDANNPCDEGYTCAKLPDKDKPVCIRPEALESSEYKGCNIAESYPVQVICPGKEAAQEKPVTNGCEKDSDCKISGCNNEICYEETRFSTCVYKPEFECYKLAKCKCFQGRCGWEQPREFSDCLAKARKL
ncbi:MAG: hypothetical protein Q8N77_05485 [Nanoarchaeota archaeon]|nr:hypothetical protein [Nanoarchaeota archaeon]